MKKILTLCASALVLSACSNDPQPASPSAPVYDMQAVRQYESQVASGRTVSAADKARVARQGEDPMPMNRSDSEPKYSGYRTPVAIVPTIGVGYGYHRHYW